MKILHIGLSRGSAIAVEMLASVVWSDPEYTRIERNMTATLGEIPRDMRDYDLCMIDILGIGYSRYTAEREMALKKIIESRPALIFIPPGSGGGWLNSVMLQDCQKDAATHCLTVQHPISSAILRDAMKDMYRRMNLKSQNLAAPFINHVDMRFTEKYADNLAPQKQNNDILETVYAIETDTSELTRKA